MRSPGVHVRRQVRVGGGDDLVRARHRLVGGDLELGAVLQLGLPFDEAAGADLRALQVSEDAHRLAAP